MAASFYRRSFLNYKNCLFQTQKRTGYVVLIPETPKEVAECNVISVENLPDFSNLTDDDQCKQIVHKYIQQYEVGAWELDEHLKEKIQASEKIDVFKHIMEPLEVLTVPFTSSWGVAKTLFIANRNLMPLSTFNNLSAKVLHLRQEKFSMNSIFSECKKTLESEEDKCTEEQKRILKKFVLEGINNGLELSQSDKEVLKKCSDLLEKKTIVYNDKLKYSKLMFKQLITDEKFGQESPLDFLRGTTTNQNDPLKGPWIINLNDAIYKRFMEYCSVRDARRHIWLTYNQICSKHCDVRCNAASEVDDIRKYRRSIAQTLGFPTYAHLSMTTKMAGSLENVQNVLSELLEPAKEGHEKELHDLEKFAYNHNFEGSIELWDLPYWKRMERKLRFGLDELTLNEYFPLSQVLLGLIALCEQLFGIEIEEQPSVEGWDPDVTYYRILDDKTKNVLGGFYFDPYWRPNKYVGNAGAGWFVTMRPRSKICAALPLSSLLFDFTPPTEDKPSLLYYREVEALFEKFGQMLLFTLTQMNYSEVSGLSNVEWDAVEISSNFLKLWLTEKGTLESISGHYNTGEPLSPKIINNLCKVNRHMAGTRLCSQIYFSNLDLELHLQEKWALDIVNEIWPQHLLFKIHPLDFHPFGFKEIFAHSWGASYFSHVWAEMIAADVFSAFKEAGFNNQEEISNLGRRFRSTFLSLGGGCEPGEIFRRFRGRNPKPKLLTDLLNLNNSPAPASGVAPELVFA